MRTLFDIEGLYHVFKTSSIGNKLYVLLVLLMLLSPDGMKRLLNYMIMGTRGGYARGRIISALKGRPQNAHQLSQKLGYDYSTIRHHLDVLMENHLILPTGERYGQVYSISPELEINYSVFLSIWRTAASEPAK